MIRRTFLENAKSISREMTFQKDVSDYSLLMDVILLLALSVEERAARYGLQGTGVNLKVTYSDMKTVTRSKAGLKERDALSIARMGWGILLKLPRRSVRLIGVGISSMSEKGTVQTTLFDLDKESAEGELDHYLERMKRKYRFDFVKNREWMLRVESLHGVVEHMRIQRSKSAASPKKPGRE